VYDFGTFTPGNRGNHVPEILRALSGYVRSIVVWGMGLRRPGVDIVTIFGYLQQQRITAGYVYNETA
jgi:hypothetical protein